MPRLGGARAASVAGQEQEADADRQHLGGEEPALARAVDGPQRELGEDRHVRPVARGRSGEGHAVRDAAGVDDVPSERDQPEKVGAEHADARDKGRHQQEREHRRPDRRHGAATP